jgi:glycosyltransferase involved in cell wall biosynthesis
LFLRFAHGIIAVSEGVADDLAVTARIARVRITVIYNPVITPHFDEHIAEQVTHPWLGDAATPFILGVGRFAPQKDFITLISAFALITQPRNLRLILLGDGPLKARLLACAQALGVAERVDMPGYTPNPFPFMRKAAALVLSSRYEGFGNVLAEALACGTPVVSTDCPHGPAEILENGRYGILVPVGDKEAMAKAITEVLGTAPDRNALRARGHEFAAEHAAERYIRLFGSVLQNR